MAQEKPDNLDWLRKKQFDEVSLQFRTMFDLYVRFYTVFLTFNFTALGLVLQFVPVAKRILIVIAFVLINLNSLITAIRIARFSRQSSKRMRIICEEIVAQDNISGDQKLNSITESAIPGELGSWAGNANAMGHVLFIVCWLAILLI